MIRTVDVRVDYDGVTAVRDLNLAIGPGEVYGLIGPNGAGKTSTIRVLATLQEPTYGEVYIDGHDAAEHPRDAQRVLGYMPDLSPVYDDLKVWELLDLFAAAHHLPRAQRRDRVEQCLAAVGLEAKRNTLAGTLSRGMTQRLVLGKTLLHRPRVLLLDEPASGLDPIARIDLRNLLKQLAAEGRTVLISSHILTELSGFCTSIGVMEKGVLVESGRIDAIVARLSAQRVYTLAVVGDPGPAEAALGAMDAVASVTRVDHALEVALVDPSDEAAADVLGELVRGGVRVRAFVPRQFGVEDIMLKLGAREVS